MFNQLTALGYGILVFAVVIVVGIVTLNNFGASVAICGTGFSFNTSAAACSNATNSSQATVAPTNTAYTTTTYLNTQLGSTGLSGWTPAIVALSIGLLFLGALAINKGNKGRY